MCGFRALRVGALRVCVGVGPAGPAHGAPMRRRGSAAAASRARPTDGARTRGGIASAVDGAVTVMSGAVTVMTGEEEEGEEEERRGGEEGGGGGGGGRGVNILALSLSSAGRKPAFLASATEGATAE